MKSLLSKSACAVGTLAVSFVLVSSARADLLLPVSQDRSIVATAYAAGPDDFVDDSDSDSAADFGPFVTGVSASAQTESSIGSGGGSQNSSIGADLLTATGSMFANGEVWEFGFSSGGVATNRFDVTFDLTANAEYTLEGNLGRFDRGLTTLVLDGPNGLIVEIIPPPNSLEPFALSGSLDSGRYRLTVTSTGTADGYDFDSDYASGEFEVELQFQGSSSVPSAQSEQSALAAFPNPFRHGVTIVWPAIPDEGRGPVRSVKIVDAGGRLVRTLSRRTSQDHLVWNGRNGAGDPVPPGLYFVRVEFRDFALVHRLIRTG